MNASGHLKQANLYAALLKLTFLLWILTFAFLTPIAKKQEGIKKDAEYIIMMTWDKGNKDVDLWLQIPTHELVFYKHKETALINLERDDLGLTGDYMTINGRTVENPLNQEIITFRGIVPGPYVLNIHLFKYDGDDPQFVGLPIAQPVKVTITITKINPTIDVVFTKEVVLTKYLEELPITTFTIEANGQIDNFDDTNPISLLDIARTY